MKVVNSIVWVEGGRVKIGIGVGDGWRVRPGWDSHA